MNGQNEFPSLPMRSKRCRIERAAFASPVLTWLLVLAPAIGLLLPFGLSLWAERAAKQFLQREAAKVEATFSADYLSGPVLEHSELSTVLTSAISTLRDRQEFYGDKYDPRAIEALARDAEPVFKLIQENIHDSSKAILIGVALSPDYWLLEIRFLDASNRDDTDTIVETLRWSALMSPQQATPDLLFQQLRWVQSIVEGSVAVEQRTLGELDSLLLQKPIDIESRNRESLKQYKMSELNQMRNGSSGLTYTDQLGWYREAENLEAMTQPEKLLSSSPEALFRHQSQGPFAASLGNRSYHHFSYLKSYFYQFARLMEYEDQRRRLRLGVAARLQVRDTGKIPQSIDELASPDPKVPLAKSSIWGMPYQLTSWQIEVDGKTRDMMKIHPVVNPSDSTARLWFSSQNPIVRLQPPELTLLLRESSISPAKD